jgi:hypothetical protein
VLGCTPSPGSAQGQASVSVIAEPAKRAPAVGVLGQFDEAGVVGISRDTAYLKKYVVAAVAPYGLVVSPRPALYGPDAVMEFDLVDGADHVIATVMPDRTARQIALVATTGTRLAAPNGALVGAARAGTDWAGLDAICAPAEDGAGGVICKANATALIELRFMVDAAGVERLAEIAWHPRPWPKPLADQQR